MCDSNHEQSLLSEPSGSLLCHYTSVAAGLDHILKARTIRLSPFTTMNDPREAKEWTATVSTSDPDYGGVDLNEITRNFNTELKSHLKVACFTSDVVRQERDATVLDRGWSHPRMWASYANDHAGLCLVFKKHRLIERFNETFEDAETFLCGPVLYSDEDPLATPAFMVNAAEVRRQGIQSVLREHAANHAESLFFTKLTDWASENEYRLLVRGADTEPVFLDFDDALAGVCVGHRWSNQRDDELVAACNDHGVAPFQVWWRNGHPALSSYHAET